MVNDFMPQSGSKRSANREGCRPNTVQTIVERALSFLRETKGVLNWSVFDLAGALKISRHDAELVLIALQAEGYVQPGWGPDNWITTQADESAPGMKPLDS
jgi:hypothetical protein